MAGPIPRPMPGSYPVISPGMPMPDTSTTIPLPGPGNPGPTPQPSAPTYPTPGGFPSVLPTAPGRDPGW